MNKKIILIVSFLISLLPMLFNQYGGAKGVQEISGLINLFNPIGIISTVFVIIGFWITLKNKIINKVLSILGLVGIIISEVYKFFTWHVLTITGEISLQSSIRLAFPEFYVGLIISIIMLIMYFIIDKYMKEELKI